MKKTNTFTMRIPEEINDFLKNYAEINFTSKSNIVIQLITKLRNDLYSVEKFKEKYK